MKIILPNQLTLRQATAQCIMPRISADKFFSDELYRNQARQLVVEGIGGFCVFSGTLTETEKMLRELQQLAKIPLLFSADFEHGLPMRLEGGTSFPHAMALGKTGNLPVIFRVAQSIAREAKAIGIHWNLAPVCDINSNKQNPIINIRAFGESPEIVGKCAESYVSGTQSEKVLASAKHFPGHGDTDVDSHLNLPTLNFDAERLRNFEFEPFRRTISAGVQSVMIGHLSVPSLDESGLPASLSFRTMSKILREELGFNGLIITDALDMKAIADVYSSAESAVLSFSAGADILLLPASPMEALNALEQAVIGEKISPERLRDSVQRILDAKKWCGAIPSENPEEKAVELPFSINDHRRLALETAEMALEWFGDVDKIESFGKYKIVAGFAFVEENDMDSASSFFRYVSQCYEFDCDFAFVDETISESDLAELAVQTSDAEIFIFPIFIRAKAYKGTVALPEKYIEIMKRLSGEKPTVAILFGNPYLRESFSATAYLCAYSDSEGSLAAAAVELVNRRKAGK